MSEEKIIKTDVQETLKQEELDAIMAKYDKESAFRRMTGPYHYAIAAIAIIFSLFQLSTAIFLPLPTQIMRASHLGFVLVLAFFLYPATKNMPRDKMHWSDLVLGIMGAVVTGYIIWNYQGLISRAGAYTTLDKAFGVVGILLVLEACRRVVGIPILVIACVFIAYAYFGKYMPGFLNHRGYSPDRIISHLFFTTEGIMGIPLGVSSTYIFLFILFGAFLDKTGIGKFFIDLANSIAGFAAGGPAKVAVLSSALMGTVSGSSVSNVVGTGSFTIPMMKSLGYKANFAGAVEAAASTGGQLMPPIMGAAAFLMAETLGVSYVTVAKAAIVPALLYFSGVWIGVHLEAKRLGLKGLSKDELPKVWDVLKDRGHLFLPLAAIIYFLINGSTPMKAALYGIVFSVVASMFKKSTRLTFKDFVEALEMGGRNIIGVAIACGTAGIIVGIVTLTGLGLKMATGLIGLSGGMMILTLFFTMISSLILGMGAPTTANYIITSTIAAPAIVKLGVPMLAAHLFTFYFGIVADITPPVALAAYAGSAISKGNPLKTGVNATKLAIAAFLVPYIFIYSPSLLLINTTPFEVIQIVATSLIGMVGVGAGVQGYLIKEANPIERILLFAGGLMLIKPGIYTDIAGVVLIALIWLYQKRKLSSQNAQQNNAAV